MTDDTLKTALQSLTATTKAGRLRELLPTIEAKVAAGIRHEDILEALNSHGFELTERTYKTYLYRLRKEVKAGKEKPALPSPSAAAKQSNANPSPPATVPQVKEKKPGEPERFDWDKHQNEKPEW